MHIVVRSRGLEVGADVRAAVERRARFALGRFGGRVRSAAALVVDENGPRGGADDKRCRVEVRLRDGGRVRVERAAVRALDAADEALDRAALALARHLGRARAERRPGATEPRRPPAPRATGPEGEPAPGAPRRAPRS
jgi:hypothetical protein